MASDDGDGHGDDDDDDDDGDDDDDDGNDPRCGCWTALQGRLRRALM